MRKTFARVNQIILVLLVLSMWMAGCSPAILNSTPEQPTAQPEQQTPTAFTFPTPQCLVKDTDQYETQYSDYGYPPVNDRDWVEGPQDAAVTIVFYGDFLCPYSVDLDVVLTTLREAYPQDLRVVFRQYPLQQSYVPALALEAAGLQSAGVVTDLRHYLFSHQADWINMTGEQFVTWLHPYLLQLGLDTDRFEADLLSDTTKQALLDDIQSAEDLQIPGTPFVLINQKPYTAMRDEASLREIIDRYKTLSEIKIAHFDACPPQVIDPGQALQAKIITTQGEILVKLFTDEAPFTVNNFVFLARQGWYNDNPFYRVIPGMLLQSGDPSGTGSGDAGYVFDNEIRSDVTFDQAGVLAMANSGSDQPISNSSQFFITSAVLPEYNGGYTIFGQVIDGMDILKNFSAIDPMSGSLQQPKDRIISIEILEGN